MKVQFIGILLWLIHGPVAFAQSRSCCENCDPVFIDLLINGDFALYDSTCLATHAAVHPCPDPIQSGCVDGWSASHGSPEFSIPDHAAILGSVKSGGYVWGEGIYQNLTQPLDSGKTFILFIDYQLMDDFESSFLSIQLTNQEFHPGSCFEMSPHTGWEIREHPLLALQNRQSTAIIFTAAGTYNKIWFFNRNECNTVSWMKISRIHLFHFDNPSQADMIQILQKVHPENDQQLQMLLYENCYSGIGISCLTTNPCQQDTSKMLKKKKNPQR